MEEEKTQAAYAFLKKYFKEAEHQSLEQRPLKDTPKAQQSANAGLQEFLQQEGLYQGKIDGGFGKNTKAAVIALQKKYGLEQTGTVTDETFSLIENLHAKREHELNARQIEDMIAKNNSPQEQKVRDLLGSQREGILTLIEQKLDQEAGAVKMPVNGIGDFFHNLGVSTEVTTHHIPRDIQYDLRKNQVAFLDNGDVIDLSERTLTDPKALKATMEKIAALVTDGSNVSHDFTPEAQTMANGIAKAAKDIRGKE